MLYKLLEADKALDHTYYEEFRCAVHFLLMVLVGCDAKLSRQQVLFQKFLRESRYRLASNGITPPTDIFRSESFASINTPLVAGWLASLTNDERDRFNQLQMKFAEEQQLRDEAVDDSDYVMTADASQLAEQRAVRDKELSDEFDRRVFLKNEERLAVFTASLEGPSRAKFVARR